MQLSKIEKNGVVCTVVNSNELVITDAQTALDVLMSAKYDIGTKNIVIDKSGEVKLTARVSPRSTARGGDTIKVAIDTSRVHIFDKDTEKCICH